MTEEGANWGTELDRWLEPFLAGLSHPARRAMCPLYIVGLIGPGDRKSVQPMARRLGLGSHDGLHHFVSAGRWDAAPLEAELLAHADAMVGGPDAYLVIDDTALPKKGAASVGVAPQYASALGKNANCQTLVSLTLARGEVPVPVALRLFLPAVWTSSPEKLARTGVPEAERASRTKPEIAVAELDRIRAAGVRFGMVLADAGYGISASFRQALSARDLLWAVGIPRTQKAFPAEVGMVPPPTARRRSSQPLVPATEAAAAEALLERERWRTVTWRRGTMIGRADHPSPQGRGPKGPRGGPLKAAFAARRVRVADGPAVRLHGRNNQHMPGEEGWLVGERRSSGERKYYLANLPAGTPLRRLAATIKARPRPAAAGRACGNGSSALRSMGLRAGPSATEGGTWSRPLRGPFLGRPAPARLDDADRLRVPAAPTPRPSGAGEKGAARHPSRACRRCGGPSSIVSSARIHRPRAARTAGNGSRRPSPRLTCQSSARRNTVDLK